ncbi:isomerase-like protein [Dinothrombium tinctorium]|uniref:Isomerase-like protein n=1 Tax=Dinothrombium tinctorium TaxID=1965070 RepID=A0A3S3QBP7_9ACAR|nr:isomerase-like protein [Dinothrombium tinctorium]RWS17316.1 isomerase-like protein [Dinothrombium tinctorium]
MEKILSLYIVDAFVSKHNFSGNPAAVCILNSDDEIEDNLKQKIAAEVNLSETAFVSHRNDNQYTLRWFTPTVEVGLCGHATLATAFVLFNNLKNAQQLTFHLKSSKILNAEIDREKRLISVKFPALFPKNIAIESVSGLPEIVENVLIGSEASVKSLLYSEEVQYLIIHLNENIEYLQNLKPNFDKLQTIETNGIIKAVGVTVDSGEKEIDYFARFFAPWLGVNEDPVTGSLHTILGPYWCELKQKKIVVAKQESKRTGILLCELIDNVVSLRGKCDEFLSGELKIQVNK